jgi:dipeptidyl aminopeptidase/acylaminoacyl peptidase
MPRLAFAPVILLAVGSAAAEEPYKQPPSPIGQILDADPLPLARVSPDRRSILLMERYALPPISEVAAEELRLAGRRIDPRTNGPSREAPFKGLRVVGIGGAGERRIETPPDARVTNVGWSADSSKVAFTAAGEAGIALWVADAATGRARRLTEPVLNAAAGAPCAWISPSAGFVCRTRVAGRGAPPAAPTTPAGPVIQQSAGRAAPNRTYEDLLQSPADEALFEHYFTAQVVHVSPDGVVRPLGAPGLHLRTGPSPDGRYLLVETAHRPFSYLVPLERFPRRLEVWDSTGRLVRGIADRGLQEEVSISFDAVPTGPRAPEWRQDAPATLTWVEALDGGDPAKSAEKRDRLLSLAAPFSGEPTSLFDAAYRVRNVEWARDDLALVEESWRKTRRTRAWAIAPGVPARAARLIFERSSEDRYGDPGRFATMQTPQGAAVLLTTADGASAYLFGDGASPEGDRPFVDRIDLASAKATRLWRSEAPFFEEPQALLDADGQRVLTRRESTKDVPNYFIRDLQNGGLTRMTNLTDPAPQLAGVEPRLIRYKRADGVELSAKLYLPPGYDFYSRGPLPFLLWAYPREFDSAAAASQVTGSPYRFTRPTGPSPLFLLTQGYGVLDDPAMPIVGGGGKEPNDTYIEQLVADAEAAVDAIVTMGVADRNRIAIGGHSYGAFMTANLLAHSDLFRAGIARSGAYNRSLTPFGFQAEERPLWKARDIYMRMSPFNYADKINEPILLIHGMADNNSGTFPIQTERLYAAIKGNGGRARLVMLPAEAHGYRARQSVGHVLWEMVNWLDTYVKNPGPSRDSGS